MVSILKFLSLIVIFFWTMTSITWAYFRRSTPFGCFYLCLVPGQHQPFLQNNNLALIIAACHIHRSSCLHQGLEAAVSSHEARVLQWNYATVQKNRSHNIISQPHLRENKTWTGNEVTSGNSLFVSFVQAPDLLFLIAQVWGVASFFFFLLWDHMRRAPLQPIDLKSF